VSRYQKGKTNLDFTEARDSVCVCVCEGAVAAGATRRAGVTTESDTQRGGTAETRQSRGNFSTVALRQGRI